MDSSVAYLFVIIFFVITLNFYFLFARMRRGNKRKRMDRTAIDEAKQALWRDKEVARRLEREKDDAIERIKLRNETLALYDEVRRRHGEKTVLDQLGPGAYDTDAKQSYYELDSMISSYLSVDEPEGDIFKPPDISNNETIAHEEK